MQAKGPGASGIIHFDDKYAPYNPTYEVVNLFNKTWKHVSTAAKYSMANVNSFDSIY